MGEDAHADHGVEFVGLVVQCAAQGHPVKGVIDVFALGHIEHPLGKVHGHQVFVTSLGKAFTGQSGAGPSVQYVGRPIYVLGEDGGGVLGSVPLKFRGQIIVVIDGPLVVAVFQFFVIGRLIDPLDSFVAFLHGWRSYRGLEKRGKAIGPSDPEGPIIKLLLTDEQSPA